MSNSGDERITDAAARLFVSNFKNHDWIIGPAGSCVKQVRCDFDKLEQTQEVKRVRKTLYELVEFLHDVLKADTRGMLGTKPATIARRACQVVRHFAPRNRTLNSPSG